MLNCCQTISILETIQRNVTCNQDIKGSYQTSKTDQTSLYLQFVYIYNIMPMCYICVISLHILKDHIPIWENKNWVKTDAWYGHKCNHAFSSDQSKVWCLKYQQCIIRKKEKIRLERTYTDILLIKLKKKINFQLFCKLTHAYILKIVQLNV